MGWHDCVIYALRFDDEFQLDIDYIFKWVMPQEPEKTFKFWISPVTIIFENVVNVKISIDLSFVNGIEIADLSKEVLGDGKIRWIFETQAGFIEFLSSGFKQFTKKHPILKGSKCLTDVERGGYNFDKKFT
jgi:hypothetical protein